MEFNEKSSVLAKTIIIIFFGGFLTQCNSGSKKINCEEINKKSVQFINQYYIDNNKSYLDSALFYTNKGINNCRNYKNTLSLRKLSILSDQQRFSEAIQFVETFDKDMFSDLPYYQKLLINRFKAMYAIDKNDINKRDKYLERCVVMVEDYLLANKGKVDSLLKQPSIENILKNPLSTALTQYYYYKSVNDYKNVKEELKEKKDKKGINSEFIEYLINYSQTDFMEFNGI